MYSFFLVCPGTGSLILIPLATIKQIKWVYSVDFKGEVQEVWNLIRTLTRNEIVKKKFPSFSLRYHSKITSSHLQ